MNRIAEAFDKKKAFIPFITAGDPSLEVTEQLLYAMEEAGADLIEIAECGSSGFAPVFPIAFPATEFPPLVSIAHKLLSALLAHQRVICFLIQFLLVGIPPSHPAPIRAEPLFFPALILDDRFPTLWADMGIRRSRMPPQVRLYRIDWQVQFFCDCRGTFSLPL